MQSTHTLHSDKLSDAWTSVKAQGDLGLPPQPASNRLAFVDPEFMLRPELRGVRLQLEMIKPDLAQEAMGIEHTVVVFGSARFVDHDTAQANLAKVLAEGGDPQALAQARTLARNAKHYEHARTFGQLVARHSLFCPIKQRIFVCTGGGPGIMEAANRGASEVGAPSIGLNIALPHEQGTNAWVTPELSFRFHYFAIRKMHFVMRAKALVAFPGGFGTLDELFEVITLVQCKKALPVPIILFGTDYWKRLLNLDVLLEEGTISHEDMQLFSYTDDPLEAWHTICHFYGMDPSPAC